MVSLNIDFYELKEKFRTEIVSRLERIEINNYPLNASWLLYALYFEGREANIFFEKGFNEIEKWTLSDTSGKKDKDLGPLSICWFLSTRNDIKDAAINKVKIILKKALPKSGLKFNVLNDPEQIFCISFLKNKIEEKIKAQLLEIIKSHINGRITRKVLFTASLIEFGENVKEIKNLNTAEDVEDIILILWFFERYKNDLKENLLTLWRAFEDINPVIEMSPDTEVSYISNMDLAFLYESVIIEIKEPDPNMLFDLYPLHKEIKNISYDYFKNRKYASAIFEVTKKLNEMIQNITGIKNKNEAELIQSTMKQIQKPKDLVIAFNDFLSEESGKNEQKGLALISEGIFSAFRNPKGHKPEDHPLLEIKPYEALDQLIVIDYIWKRIESAKINRKDNNK